MRDSSADHVPDALLVANAASTLAGPDLAYVEEHLHVCEKCRARQAEEDYFIKAFRSAVRRKG
jgi:predicted anti-sigma-YlaC factor YlaD